MCEGRLLTYVIDQKITASSSFESISEDFGTDGGVRLDSQVSIHWENGKETGGGWVAATVDTDQFIQVYLYKLLYNFFFNII